jgi:hypothetical protein
VQQDFPYLEIRVAETGVFNAGGCVAGQEAHRFDHTSQT